jgi:hypothetical protein
LRLVVNDIEFVIIVVCINFKHSELSLYFSFSHE